MNYTLFNFIKYNIKPNLRYYVQVITAFEDLCSLTGMKALVIDAETWPEDASANLQLLKRDVEQNINNSSGYEKTM